MIGSRGMSLEIRLIPALADNYVYLLREPASGNVAAVDPSVAEPVFAALEEIGWKLTHVFNTHHHFDHTGGNLALKAATNCAIVGPAADRARIPGIDVALADGERYRFGAAEAVVFDIPGHTRGHVAYWFAGDKALFCGDTLFAMGCGRMFEGTAPQMWASLSKLAALPGDTRVYCGHEYTQANARFALTVEPGNAALIARAQEVDGLRAAGKATIPSTIAAELATNPFLRATSPALQRTLNLDGADPVTVFAETRRRKDAFR
jgi:hydroxyacylglutathione hydrolase